MRLDDFIAPREIYVLLVDDDEFDRKVAETELCEKPKSCSVLSPLFVVKSASSLKEGLEKLHRECFDVLLLDLTLPDSRGPKTLAKVVAEFPALPIVVLTGVDDEALALKTINEGAQDYVVKGERCGALARTIVYAIQRRKIWARLQEAEREAVAGTQAKSTFLANMSHEIRTPLTAILGFTEIALDEAANEKQRAALLVTKRNGEHLLQVINDILDISKIESGKFEIENKPVKLFRMLEHLESTFNFRAAEKGLSLGFEYHFPLPVSISTDELHLRQILFNLIGNALKFTSTGGVKVAVRLSRDSSALNFEIIDTGIGLSKEELERLFKPFSQADASTTRKFGGTGLGLNISKELAQVLGGDITVVSSKGNGSIFTLKLLINDPKSLELVESKPDAEDEFLSELGLATSGNNSSSSNLGRILLADDMPDNRELIGYLLSPLKAEIISVENGKLALDRAITESFDVILLDMHMPVLDGYECAKQLRAQGISTPILAVTASAMNGALDRCLEAGCNDYIRKPFRKDVFLKMVSKYIHESRQRQGPSPVVEEPVIPIVSRIVEEDPKMISVVLGFVERYPRRVECIKKAWNEQDWVELKRFSHQLASAELFGFAGLGKIGQAIEMALDNRNYQAIAELVMELVSTEKGVLAGRPQLLRALEQSRATQSLD